MRIRYLGVGTMTRPDAGLGVQGLWAFFFPGGHGEVGGGTLANLVVVSECGGGGGVRGLFFSFLSFKVRQLVYPVDGCGPVSRGLDRRCKYVLVNETKRGGTSASGGAKVDCEIAVQLWIGNGTLSLCQVAAGRPVHIVVEAVCLVERSQLDGTSTRSGFKVKFATLDLAY